MGGRGRKNLKRGVQEDVGTLPQGQTIMQVVDLRGNNLLQVMDRSGEKLLAIFPSKFHKSMWTKRGNFVVVDESGREEAVESGRKVVGIVTQVLYYDQIRLLQKSPDWPDIFKSSPQESSTLGLLPSSTNKDSIPDLLPSSSNKDSIPGLLPSSSNKDSIPGLLPSSSNKDEECSSSDDDGLPPLEANTNRSNPLQRCLDTDSESDSDS